MAKVTKRHEEAYAEAQAMLQEMRLLAGRVEEILCSDETSLVSAFEDESGRIADGKLEQALRHEDRAGNVLVDCMEDIRRAQQMLDAAMKAALEADVAAE